MPSGLTLLKEDEEVIRARVQCVGFLGRWWHQKFSQVAMFRERRIRVAFPCLGCWKYVCYRHVDKAKAKIG